MDILKSFEVFLTEPLSVLKDRIVQVVGITTGLNTKPEISADLLDKKAQITVFNSDKMYNLLKRVNARTKVLEDNSGFTKIFTKKDDKPKAVFGQLTLRL